MTTTTKAIIAIISGLVIATIGVLLIVYRYHDAQIAFKDSGVVGDTIGGIAGPILNLAGMIVVYLTLQAQMQAFQHEVKKTADERTLKGIEQSIESAARELQHQKGNLQTALIKIKEYDNRLKSTPLLYGATGSNEADMKVYKVRLKKELDEIAKREDAKLTVVAGLIKIAYFRLANNDLPSQYLSYGIELFQYQIITVLNEYHLIRDFPTALDDSYVVNTLGVMGIRDKFYVVRQAYYERLQGLAPEPSLEWLKT